MRKIDVIRNHLKCIKDCGFEGPKDVLLGNALDAIEKAAAFVNVGTIYTGTQEDAARLKAACEAMQVFFDPVPNLIQEPAEPSPEPKKKVSLPVIQEKADAKP